MKGAEDTLREKLRSKKAQYREPIADIFGDPRIEDVMEEVDQGIFEIFMSNYLQQFRENVQVYDLNQATVPDIPAGEQAVPTFMVDLRRNHCSCGYPVKVGLPCSHMLALARKDESVGYKDLVSRLWKILLVERGFGYRAENPLLVKFKRWI